MRKALAVVISVGAIFSGFTWFGYNTGSSICKGGDQVRHINEARNHGVANIPLIGGAYMEGIRMATRANCPFAHSMVFPE